eukprot:scaffold76709_cov69-Phaeocystis_antarctica.AAC.2
MSRSVEPPALGICWKINGRVSEGTAPNAAALPAKAQRTHDPMNIMNSRFLLMWDDDTLML